MDIALNTIIFILGTIVGSFLNVVILRYNTGVSFFSGRSFCPSCSKKLSWYELVPVISFFALRGKCAGCGSKISWQYPLVEIVTGVLFVLTAIYEIRVMNYEWGVGFNLNSLFLFLNSLYFFAIWSILVVIFVYDLRHKIIPDGLVFLFAGLSLAHIVFTVGFSKIFTTPYFWDLLAGPLFALPFAALWFFSKGQWMGLGDAKLALGIGWFLGLILGGSAIILGFWMGAIVGLALIGISKLSLAKRLHSSYGLKSEIPFGPFLILGTIIAFFFNINVFDLGLIVF